MPQNLPNIPKNTHPTPKIYKSNIPVILPLDENFQVLLFYKYTKITDTHKFAIQQRAWCDELGLTGRILVGAEGINATLEGGLDNSQKYIKRMDAKLGFEGIHWKKSIGTGFAFPKLSIKVREEIVSTNIEDRYEIGPHNGVTGKYLKPYELNKWIYGNKKFYIVDMRNDFEFALGHFVTQKNTLSNVESILSINMTNFRDLPTILPLLEGLENETIVTVCTGGIRCEKASGFLLKNGFKDVYQLEGGIVSYMEQYPNQDFVGKLYVFDGRVAVGFNTQSQNHTIIGKCKLCNVTSENNLNYKLKNDSTNTRYHGIICQKCLANGSVVIC